MGKAAHKFEVKHARIERKPRQRKKRKPPGTFRPIGNVRRARWSGTIATICEGRRIVREYYSGEPLLGYIE